MTIGLTCSFTVGHSQIVKPLKRPVLYQFAFNHYKSIDLNWYIQKDPNGNEGR